MSTSQKISPGAVVTIVDRSFPGLCGLGLPRSAMPEAQSPIADPWLAAPRVPRGPRGLLNRVGFVMRQTDRDWLRRMIAWPGAGKRVRIAAQDRLDELERESAS